MNHTKEEQEKELLAQLEGDVKILSTELAETVKAIVDGGYSKFPVLIAHVDDIAIAQKVIDKNESQSFFSFSASTMEEMISRKIIVEDRKADFEKQFKAHSEDYCILLLHPDTMKFVFAKRKVG
jgi:hypothetical protein